jgi:DNA (cytosine-5)-methyltransferase 1
MTTSSTPLTHFSLFSGIGGLDLAAEWAGFQTVGQIELKEYPYKVLCQHWPDVPKWRDIKDVTSKSIRRAGITQPPTLLSGGFPCQPFSTAGQRRGAEDDRYLWPEMFRLVQQLRPAWVVGENVAGIISMALDDVCSDLESAGYSYRAFVIPAAATGAPHLRQRVFVVANTGGVRLKARSERERRGAEEKRRLPEPISRDGLRQWVCEPGMDRVVDGAPDWVDRVEALGNAVVPQQVYPIFLAIAEVEKMVEER